MVSSALISKRLVAQPVAGTDTGDPLGVAEPARGLDVIGDDRPFAVGIDDAFEQQPVGIQHLHVVPDRGTVQLGPIEAGQQASGLGLCRRRDLAARAASPGAPPRDRQLIGEHRQAQGHGAARAVAEGRHDEGQRLDQMRGDVQPDPLLACRLPQPARDRAAAGSGARHAPA